MKFAFIILLVCLKFLFTQHFDIVYVGSQKWGGGISTAGSGKNYKFSIRVNDSSKNLKFKTVKIGLCCYSANVFTKINSEKGVFEKNDTIHFQVNIKSGNANDTCIEEFPEEFLNQNVVIKYQFKDKDYYRVIEEIKEEKPLLYP